MRLLILENTGNLNFTVNLINLPLWLKKLGRIGSCYCKQHACHFNCYSAVRPWHSKTFRNISSSYFVSLTPMAGSLRKKKLKRSRDRRWISLLPQTSCLWKHPSSNLQQASIESKLNFPICSYDVCWTSVPIYTPCSNRLLQVIKVISELLLGSFFSCSWLSGNNNNSSNNNNKIILQTKNFPC